MQKVHLVIIDPQIDFTLPKGSLYVAGADKDMERLSSFIAKNGNKLYDISVTLDSHHRIDIAHALFWKNSSGQHPNPFTIITKDDVLSGKWTTNQPSFYKRALEYVTLLEKNGRYPLCVWPDHCLIGSEGNAVHPELYKSLLDWEGKNFAMVNYVTKGSNLWTEHYSAVRADVVDPKDPTTQINTEFIKTLEDSDFVVVAGEASSHCVSNTLRDILDISPDISSKIVLLKDAMSPVGGFEKLADDFFDDMLQKGVKISTTTEFLQ